MSSYRFVVLGMPEACTLEVVLTLCECVCAALQMAERSMISDLAVHEYDFVKAKKAKGGQWRWLSGPPDAPLGRLRWTRQGGVC